MKTGSIVFALNASGGQAPTCIQLLPAGPQVVGRDGRAWRLTDTARLVQATRERGVDLCVDVNHATDLRATSGADAPAVGWIGAITTNASGEVWGDVDWTDEGKELVASRKYRYVSPVFSYDEATNEIVALVGAALTNRPNLRLHALNQEFAPDGLAAGHTDKEATSMKKLCAALGLPETATEDQAMVALNALKTKAEGASRQATAQGERVDLAAYAPRADLALMETRALNAERVVADLKATDLKKRAEGAVDAAIAARKIAPSSRTAYLTLCASEEGLKQFGDIVASTAAILPEGGQAPAGQAPATETALNAEELATAKSMGYSETEWKKVKEAANK